MNNQITGLSKSIPKAKLFTAVFAVILIIASVNLLRSSFGSLYGPKDVSTPSTPVISPTPGELAEQAKQAKNEADKRIAELREYQKTPAGKLCTKHPTWTREECSDVVAGKYWVGMQAEMLTYKRGNPNHVNPSNYGNGERYQYCWTGWSPSCFYDNNGDGVIDSYN